MENLKELNHNDLKNLNGGNDLTDWFWYEAGATVRFLKEANSHPIRRSEYMGG